MADKRRGNENKFKYRKFHLYIAKKLFLFGSGQTLKQPTQRWNTVKLKLEMTLNNLLYPGFSSVETSQPSDSLSNLNCSGILKFIYF